MKYDKPDLKRLARTGDWLRVAVLSVGLAAPFAISFAPAEAAVPIPVRELWPGQRALILLPMGLGEGWNSTQEVGAAVLPETEQRLRSILRATDKFSLIDVHRFNPVLMRAVQERRITQEQFNTLLKDTSLSNARIVLSKMGFEQPPFVADFRLEEVRPGGAKLKPTVQVQISARLYELGGQTASNAVVVTSKPAGGGNDDLDRILMAATDAFAQATAQLLTPPDDTFLLPRVEAPAPGSIRPVRPTPVVSPPPPRPVVPVRDPSKPGVVLPGDVPIAGASERGGSGIPHLPTPTPPVGIAVPNSPSVAP